MRDAARALQGIRILPPASRESSSFRDPEGRVFVASGRVFRGIAGRAADRLRDFLRSGFYRERAGTRIVETWEVAPEEVLEAGVSAGDVGAWAMWAEHRKLPLVTYPYEWPFECLKQAACLTLDLLADALRNGYTLKDASAFNVQFVDSRPIFIDILSFEEYEEGAPFFGYKQFCEQFFAPLCLSAFAGIDFNQWFKGRLDGLDLIEVSSALPLTTRCRPQVLMHVHSQAWAMRKLKSASGCAGSVRNRRRIPCRNLIALADGLRRYTEGLERKRRTYWQKYAAQNSYDERSRASKTRIAKEFVARTGPARLLDLGCNIGEYSKVAIDAGAGSVIGVDSDCGALDLAAGQAPPRRLAGAVPVLGHRESVSRSRLDAGGENGPGEAAGKSGRRVLLRAHPSSRHRPEHPSGRVRPMGLRPGAEGSHRVRPQIRSRWPKASCATAKTSSSGTTRRISNGCSASTPRP